MTSSILTDYLGQGPAASRPATPPIGTAALAFYYADDTGVLSLWDTATSAWVTAGGAGLSTSNTWTAAQIGAVVTLTDGATITANFSLGNNFAVTLGGNRTLANPSSVNAGQGGQIVVTQDGTGGRTLAYGSDWKFPGGTAPVLSTAAGATDILSYYVVRSTFIAVSPALAFA